eukprot:c328_g1_i1 orf=22-282(-)
MQPKQALCTEKNGSLAHRSRPFALRKMLNMQRRQNLAWKIEAWLLSNESGKKVPIRDKAKKALSLYDIFIKAAIFKTFSFRTAVNS